VSDLVSKESDEANALGALRDRYGWFDTPLSTRDTDHPVVMKIKNIVEGMGFGLFFDGLAYTLKKGGKPVVDQIIARNKNIKDQTVEAGVAQLRRGDEEFRADKNAPLAQPHQGAHVSQTDATTARRQLERTRKEWGAEEGSAGSVTTPVERERIAQYGGTDEKTVERVMRDLMTDEGFRAKMKAAKGNLKSLAERYGDAVATHQKVTVGRNAVDFNGAEYLKDVLEAERDLIDGEKILKPGEEITVSFSEKAKGWVSFKSFIPEISVSAVKQYYTFKNGQIWKHHTNEIRNDFYGEKYDSTVTPVLNSNPELVKNFNTLNYEGSQAKIDKFTTLTVDGVDFNDGNYYNLLNKNGWYVKEIFTDKQQGTVNEFIEKEGKWFNYIKGLQNQVDTSAFNFQGLGIVNSIIQD